jgi:hypothetical protein
MDLSDIIDNILEISNSSMVLKCTNKKCLNIYKL